MLFSENYTNRFARGLVSVCAKAEWVSDVLFYKIYMVLDHKYNLCLKHYLLIKLVKLNYWKPNKRGNCDFLSYSSDFFSHNSKKKSELWEINSDWWEIKLWDTKSELQDVNSQFWEVTIHFFIIFDVENRIAKWNLLRCKLKIVIKRSKLR